MTAVARILFLIAGGLWLAIGVAAPLLLGKGVGPPMVYISTRTDTALFGAPPDQVLAGNPQLVMLRMMLIRSLSGLMVAAGLAVLGLAWFGMRTPDRWVLGLLAVIGAAVLPFWWSVFAPYRAAGIRLAIGDLPPFMWVPAILMPVASVFGWLGTSA